MRRSLQKLGKFLNHPPNFTSNFPNCREYSSTLFVKGISFFSREPDLVEVFSKFGEVDEAKIIMDKKKERSKGYGYVTFANEEDAKKALIEMNGKVIQGRVVFVDTARPKRY